MFLGHDYLDGQHSLNNNQSEGQDATQHYVDPTQLLYDPTMITKNRGLKVNTDNADMSLASYGSSAGDGGLDFGNTSDLAIDPRLLLGDDSGSLSANHTPAPEEWGPHHADAHGLSGHNAGGGGVSGYTANVGAGAGAHHDQYGYLMNPAMSHQLTNFPGPNDVNGAYNPFLYPPPNANDSYLNDPFLYATHGHQEHSYSQHLLPDPSQSSYQEQLRELNPNHLDTYEDRELFSKKKRPEKIRAAKPLTMEELEHDNSRFARVVKALCSIEDPIKRTVPEIAKAVQDMYPGRYADFEAVKRMVNDVLQKHKAFYHNGRGSPYVLRLEEGRARKEFPSTRNARGSRHEVEEENIPPRMMYGRRSSRYPRRNRSQDLRILQHGVDDPNMLMHEYMNSPLDGLVHDDQQYYR